MNIEIPDHLYVPMAELLQKAESTGVSEERMQLCAWLLLCAQRRPESELPRGNRVPIPNYSLAGALHGIEDAENHPEEVARRYAQGRKASQQVQASAKGALTQFEMVFKKNREALPLKIVDEALNLIFALGQFVSCADPGMDLINRTRPKREDESYSSNSLALLWWRYSLYSPNEQYWGDMFKLATVWGLTKAANLESFRRIVAELTQFKDSLPAPPYLRPPNDGIGP